VDGAGIAALMDVVELVDDVEPVDEVEPIDAEAAAEAAWAAPTAMPVPKPRNAAMLIAPATTRERAAGWWRPFRPVPGEGRAAGR
jgi:hypothetical protein